MSQSKVVSHMEMTDHEASSLQEEAGKSMVQNHDKDVQRGAHTAEKKLIRRVKHIVDVAVNADGGTRLRRIHPTKNIVQRAHFK